MTRVGGHPERLPGSAGGELIARETRIHRARVGAAGAGGEELERGDWCRKFCWALGIARPRRLAWSLHGAASRYCLAGRTCCDRRESCLQQEGGAVRHCLHEGITPGGSSIHLFELLPQLYALNLGGLQSPIYHRQWRALASA